MALKRKFVFCMAGMGLGNATRNDAIMERIPEDSQITVMAWGLSLEYFRSRLPSERLVALIPYLPSEKGGLYGLAALFSIPRFVGVYLRNSFRIAKYLYRERPHVAVLDSDFHFLPFLLFRIPIVCISQAPLVFREWKNIFETPVSLPLWLRCLLFEGGDSLLTGLFAEKTLVPSLLANRNLGRNRMAIPLIVRKTFLNQPQGKAEHKIGFLNGGSAVYGASMRKLASERNWVSLLDQYAGNDRFPRSPVMRNAEIVATQCGLSSLSECIALRKKVIAVPIAGHPEQEFNAKAVQKLGLSFDPNEEQTPPQTEPNWPRCDGAVVAAAHILSVSRS